MEYDPVRFDLHFGLLSYIDLDRSCISGSLSDGFRKEPDGSFRFVDPILDQAGEHIRRRHIIVVIVSGALQPYDLAYRMQCRSAKFAHPFGSRIDRRQHLSTLFAVAPSAVMPVAGCIKFSRRNVVVISYQVALTLTHAPSRPKARLGEESKQFFFEKKNQKTFVYKAFALPQRVRKMGKKFLLLFSKRSAFLLSMGQP